MVYREIRRLVDQYQRCLPGEVVRKLEQKNILDRPAPERAKIEPWRLNGLPRRVLLQRCKSPSLRAGIDEVKK